jgi:hypothetical protein
VRGAAAQPGAEKVECNHHDHDDEDVRHHHAELELLDGLREEEADAARGRVLNSYR